MFMIAVSSGASSSSPVGATVFLAVLGVAAVCFGARFVFDPGGAVDTTLERRRIALELRGQRTGNLERAAADGMGAWFFELMGSLVGLAGLGMLALSLVLSTD
ncbi:hypothetical protein ACFWNK_00750 [Streptomyces sp. NPDC058417]|uniref:hypothetical protein n=1 Tax=unclassified Streptomyces TaxID=2593676 RepID=UPI003667DB86